MNPILFSILVLISCPIDECITLEEHAVKHECTVEELMTDILTARLCGKTDMSGRLCDECMHGTFTISHRDESNPGEGSVIEGVIIK